jgi:hypothetical protein
LDGSKYSHFDLLQGPVQGSVLGQVLYAVFVPPFFDIILLLSFADDSYNVEINPYKIELINDTENSIKAITKRLGNRV